MVLMHVIPTWDNEEFLKHFDFSNRKEDIIWTRVFAPSFFSPHLVMGLKITNSSPSNKGSLCKELTFTRECDPLLLRESLIS